MKFIYYNNEINKHISCVICNYYSDYFKNNILPKYPNTPVIICDRMDSVCLNDRNFKSLVEYDVTVLKEYVFKNPALNNYKYNSKRYHLHLIQPTMAPLKKIQLSEEKIEKILPCSWNLNQYSFEGKTMIYLKNMKIDHTHKNIDVFYICHTHASVSTLYDHRKSIFESLKKICKKHNLTCKLLFGENITKKEYLKYLAKSKICVSPYGLGGRISLDQMGILTETLIIKPDMSYLDTIPNIYDGEFSETMKFFNPDISNGYINQENEIEQLILDSGITTDNWSKNIKFLKNNKLKTKNYDMKFYSSKFIKTIKKVIDVGR